jgi:CheY-like chemotaxis protein
MNTMKTILLVDDDEEFRFQQRMQLEEAGYAVIEAPSKHQAEALLGTATPDLAIVDLMMEEVDAGFAPCYHIKKMRLDLPSILVTAVTAETGLEFDAATNEERSWGKADTMLAKPIRFDQLKREINRLLND